MNQILITLKQLADLLAAVRHALPISIITLTTPKVRKTGNPFWPLVKLAVVNGFTGADYELSVNRQRLREGKETDFDAKPRQWGTRIAPCLVENKGQLYAVIQPRHTSRPVYLTARNDVVQVVANEDVNPFLYFSTVQHQGTEKEVVYRNYLLGNILAININGKRYRVQSAAPLVAKIAELPEPKGLLDVAIAQ